MASSQPLRFGYVVGLDGLRGIAVLMVMLFHVGAPVLPGGFLGVDAFFVLSGFLITTLLTQENTLRGEIDLRHFYMRRALRLAPALTLMLLAYSASSILLLPWPDAAKHLRDAGIAAFYLTNWARAFDIHPPDYLAHTWSLGVEEQFYLLWPLILIALLRVLKSRLVLVATLGIALASWALRASLALSGETWARLYNGLDTRGDALMIGCALAVALGLLNAQQREELGSRTRWIAALAAICFAALAATSDFRSMDLLTWRFGVAAVLVASVILNVVLDPTGPLARLLSAPWLTWLGSISYGLYLWHYPVYRVLFLLEFNWAAVLLVGSLISVALAACSYYLVEQRVSRLRSRVRQGVRWFV